MNEQERQQRITTPPFAGSELEPQFSDLEWLAFRYLSDDLSPAERADFERRLELEASASTDASEASNPDGMIPEAAEAVQRMVLLLEQLAAGCPLPATPEQGERPGRRGIAGKARTSFWGRDEQGQKPNDLAATRKVGWGRIATIAAALCGLALFGWAYLSRQVEFGSSQPAGPSLGLTEHSSGIEIDTAIASMWAEQIENPDQSDTGETPLSADWLDQRGGSETASDPSGAELVDSETTGNDWLLAALVSLDELQTWPAEGQGDGT